MAREIDKLKAINLGKMKKPGRYSDGGGLWLQISRWGTKSWLFQYTAPSGKVRQMGLGALHTVSLAEARTLARLARNEVRERTDPIEARKQRHSGEQAANAKRITFKEAADRYIAERRDTWKNAVHATQWEATLKTYAFPIIGGLFVGDVTKAHVLEIVEPIWKSKTEPASRLRGRIERVLDFAIARDWRTGPNPAAWNGQLKEILPSPKKLKSVRHHPALPYAAIGKFIQRVRQAEGISARALEFTILTAARTGETIGAKWDEINLNEGLWTIPAERMKAKREHTVPLSARALEILRSSRTRTENENPYVFIGGKEGAPLSNMAMLVLLKTLKPGITAHGFRSTFRDWAAEETAFANHVVEMALAHGIDDRTEAAYRRGTLLTKRRQLMEAWSARCNRTDESKSSVTPIRGRAS